MNKALNDLRHEHEAILIGLKILDQICRKMKANQSVERDDLISFIGFLKDFADKCHHGKEEGILFPAMIKAGVMNQNGPIGALLQEHNEGRELVQQMEASLAGGVDAPSFIRSASLYSLLLRAHIQNENDVLFPLAESVLSDSESNRLFEAFEEHERSVMGAGRHEQLHDFLKNMKNQHLQNE